MKINRLIGANWPAVLAPAIFSFIAFTALSAAGAPPELSGPLKLRVSDPLVANALAARGRMIADYGSFQVVEVNAAVAGGFLNSGAVESAADMNVIRLNTGALDTTAAAVKALRRPAGFFSGKRLHLVHFAGPVKPEWHTAMAQQGVDILAYLPQNAYLVYGSAGALGRLQAWAASSGYVQWEGEYRDEYKIHPRARTAETQGLPKQTPTDLFAIQLVDDAEANAVTLALIDRIKLEPVKHSFRLLRYLNVIVRLPPGRLAEVAARPEVISIQPYAERRKLDERQDQIVAGNLTGTAPSGPGYLAWLAGRGFTQAQFTNSNFAVDVSDSGIDNGTATPGHFGLYSAGDTGQVSRVIYNRLVGTPNNPGSTIQGCDGHGTLNAHIVAGYNNRSTGFPHQDAAGYRYGLGVCPFVKVGSSVVFDPDAFTSPNYADLQSLACTNGARISANSWGGSAFGDYDIDAQQYDALVRDAQPDGSAAPASGNQPMVIVFAAGNDGPDALTVESPGTAKNVITVGASENVRSLSIANGGNDPLGTDGCDTPDTDADSANDLTFFSSQGPCSDGRMKPDLVAPGTHITGGTPQKTPPPSPLGVGSALACFDATGVCALPGSGTTGNTNDFFPLGQQFYTTSSGTSHSTPAVAGAAALLRQDFINQGLAPPSPAMTKAFLMNSARYLDGARAGDTLWSPGQGMGEINLGTAFDREPRILRDQLGADKFTGTGQSRKFSGTIADVSKPFRVTLAWTDAPGNTSGSAFNNDLDLAVTVNGSTYRGNVFSGASSVAGGTADRADNVESVFLPAGASGNFAVTVTAANINSDGVPNEDPLLDQDFALVICNAAPGTGAVVTAESFALGPESCAPTNGVVDPDEIVTVNFTLGNVGTANTTNLVAALQAGNGITPLSGPQTYGSLPVDSAAVTRSFSLAASGICGATLTATLALSDGTNNPGTVAFLLPLGQLEPASSQNFDGVTAPALPAGWTTSAFGGQSPWVTSIAQNDTSPNAAFSPDATTNGVNELVSPLIPITSGSAQLTFRHNYDFESSYDGGVLEIKIGAGPFTDILDAGGSFVTHGYGPAISSSSGNPLGGRRGWSGTSGGFVTTTANLPAAVAGQNIQLRWRAGSDQSVGGAGWYLDSVVVSVRRCCGGFAYTVPVVAVDGVTLTAESCGTNNGAVDPGETVTMNVGLKNIGTADTTNLVATLQPTGGVLYPGGAVNYGALGTNGATIIRPVSFTAGGNCGDTLTGTLQLLDGTNDLGTASFSLPLGATATNFWQNFDGVTAPNLPTNWTTSATGSQTQWVTSTGQADTPPNAAFSIDATNTGLNELDSPSVTLPAQPAQLSFRQSYDLEAGSGNVGYDGGVLEIKIGAAAFADIQVAGGTFVSGGYSHTLSSDYGNPLAGRQAWSGNSGGFVLAVVNLPASAAGQTVRLRWRCATDNSTGFTGWYVDSVLVNSRACCTSPPAILYPPQNQATVAGGTAAFAVGAVGTAPLNYQWRFKGTNLVGATATSFTRSNAQPADAGLYNVVVTNTGGSITSPAARLSIVSRPVLLGARLTNGQFTFTLNGDAGFDYEIQRSVDFSNWPVVALLTNATGQVSFSDTNALDAVPRAYRARLVP